MLTGITVEGTLYFALPAGAFADTYGNPSLQYQGRLTLDYGTLPLPLPLAAEKPAGGLIYDAGYNGNTTSACRSSSISFRRGRSVPQAIDT